MHIKEALDIVNGLGNVSQLRPARLLDPAMIHEIETKSLGAAIAECQTRKQGIDLGTVTARRPIIGGGTTYTEYDIRQKTTSSSHNIDDQIDTTDIVVDAWTAFTEAGYQIPINRFLSLHGVYIGPVQQSSAAATAIYDHIGALKFLKGAETVAHWNVLDLYDPREAPGVGTKSDTLPGYAEGYSVYQYPVWAEQEYFQGQIYLNTNGHTYNTPCKLLGWVVETGAATVAPIRKAV